MTKISQHYAAGIIDRYAAFVRAAHLDGTDCCDGRDCAIEPRYLETVGLMNILGKLNEILEGGQHPNLCVSGILVTKMDARIRGHKNLRDDLRAHHTLGRLVCGVIPANEAVA